MGGYGGYQNINNLLGMTAPKQGEIWGTSLYKLTAALRMIDGEYLNMRQRELSGLLNWI